MYIPLYLKTNNSLLQSLIKIDELIKYAKDNNINTLSITDNNMYGVIEFYHKCLNNNIKPIIGLEVIIDNKVIILYCQNSNGYSNLIKLSTINSERELVLNDLFNNSDGLICIIPFESILLYDELTKYYRYLYVTYKNDEQKSKIKNKSFYMNKMIYYNSKETDYINYLEGIRLGTTVDLIDEINDDYSLETNIKNHQKYNSDNKYLLELNELCDLKLEFSKNLLPVYNCPDGRDSFTYLKQLCMEGLKRIFGKTVNKMYIDRLKYELNIINEMGFCNYFLIVWDYIKYAKDNNILVGPGRGSAAGSLVSYCLNITNVDPLKYNLLFERFLNPERITMPDIDIDFEDTRREEVIKYCINKYGIKRVAPIITFGTLGAKQAIRDVGRVMDIELPTIDYICRMIDSRISLLDNYKQNSKLKKHLNSEYNLMKLYKIASKFEGLKRHISVHAAGIVMAKYDLDEIIPLNWHDGFYITGYSMEYLEEIGLLKMDFLGLKNLSLITNVISDINQNLNLNLTFDNIPLDDQKSLQIFNEVKTLGIFQFESNGMMNFLRKFRPTTFEDIFAALALFRPGPMNNIDSYIRRKHGKEKIDYFHKNLENILKPTYGIIVYQEQIMQIAHVMAGYSLGEADILRRAMSKKKEEVLLKEKDKFIKRSINNGYDKDIAIKVYELILKFASYGFNRAHSVAYAVIAYKMAYLKAHYKEYFMKSLLTMVIGSELKTKEYIYECKINNINILKPDINYSEDTYKVENNGLRYPLSNIKNLGVSTVSLIIDKRNEKPFSDIYDFISRTYGKTINRKTIESLIDAGAFSSFDLNKNTLYTNLDIIINYAELIKDVGDYYALKPEITLVPEFSDKELMNIELKAFGLYLSNHPVTKYKIKYNNKVNLFDLHLYFDKQIEVIIYIDKVKEIITKNNQKMGFITGSDENASSELVMFNDIYEKYRNIINNGDIVLIKGKVEKRFDKMQIIVLELKKL